ncbi:hypothetical protein C0J52_01329 [Blattella germanica]|nr:hypothetical protein C0J52_01329 [Blattella germanica]
MSKEPLIAVIDKSYRIDLFKSKDDQNLTKKFGIVPRAPNIKASYRDIVKVILFLIVGNDRFIDGLGRFIDRYSCRSITVNELRQVNANFIIRCQECILMEGGHFQFV